MKIIYRDDQQNLYKYLVNVLVVLAKNPSEEATDAICDIFKMGKIVGVDRDLERVPDENAEKDYKKWTDMIVLKHVMQKFL